MAYWRPPPGTTALLEPIEPAPGLEALTGVVLDDERLLLDLGASPLPSGVVDVAASFFTPGALWRVTGVLHPVEAGGNLYELAVKEVEKVERRGTNRVTITLTASLIVPDASGSVTSVLARTKDVSPGGCSIIAERLLPDGDPMISLDLDDDEGPLVAQAAVLARDPAGTEWSYRLMFTAIEDGDRARLGRLSAA